MPNSHLLSGMLAHTGNALRHDQSSISQAKTRDIIQSRGQLFVPLNVTPDLKKVRVLGTLRFSKLVISTNGKCLAEQGSDKTFRV